MSKRSEVKEGTCQKEEMSIRRDVKEKRGRCTQNAVFHNRNDATESKMTREMRCFTIETAVGGREDRRRQTAVAVVFPYARLRKRRLLDAL